MRIYVMRHAEAVGPGEWSGPDRNRPLTPAGEAKLAKAVEHMRRLKLSADVLLTSPHLRATQTADVLSDQLHILQCLQCPELSSGARLDAFLSLVLRHGGAQSLWFVAHMPEIAVFAARLTGNGAATERPFEPAQVLAAETSVSDGQLSSGRLLWNRSVEDWPAVSA